jgi:hypothetical protein
MKVGDTVTFNISGSRLRIYDLRGEITEIKGDLISVGNLCRCDPKMEETRSVAGCTAACFKEDIYPESYENP